MGLAPAEGPQALAAVEAFKASGLLGPAGVLTTVYNTGQQWDAPNAWPPLQDIVIEALAANAGECFTKLRLVFSHSFISYCINALVLILPTVPRRRWPPTSCAGPLEFKTLTASINSLHAACTQPLISNPAHRQGPGARPGDDQADQVAPCPNSWHNLIAILAVPSSVDILT